MKYDCTVTHMKRPAWRIATVALLPLLGSAIGMATAAEEHPDLPPSHSVKPERYATGFTFAEGPALDPSGELFVVNYRRDGTIGRISPRGGAAGIFFDLRDPESPEGRQPQANGLKIDRGGRLIAADAGMGRLLRIAADGSSMEVLADRCDGKRLNSPNDVALDTRGNIYFTDPGGSSAEDPIGSVYRFDAATKQVTRLQTGLAFPNGLAVTPDQKQLCVAESQRRRVLIFDLSEEGEVSNMRVLIDFPDQTHDQILGGDFEPDGMIFDRRGRLYVAMWNGGVVNVVEVPAGRLIRQYEAGGQRATNCHFHGGYLYTTVADKEAVFRLKLDVEGFDYRQPPETPPRPPANPPETAAHVPRLP
jgi:sugar lactone lactonase YvrE